MPKSAAHSVQRSNVILVVRVICLNARLRGGNTSFPQSRSASECGEKRVNWAVNNGYEGCVAALGKDFPLTNCFGIGKKILNGERKGLAACRPYGWVVGGHAPDA